MWWFNRERWRLYMSEKFWFEVKPQTNKKIIRSAIYFQCKYMYNKDHFQFCQKGQRSCDCSIVLSHKWWKRLLWRLSTLLVFIFKTILHTNTCNNIINSIPFPDILFVSTDFNLFDLVKKIITLNLVVRYCYNWWIIQYIHIR